MATPQFGEPQPGRDYPDRPAAFAVIACGGEVALVRVDDRAGRGPVLDLPGGGLDPGESARDAAAREVGEEAGLAVELEPEPFAAADHYFIAAVGRSVNTRGVFFAGRVTAEAPQLKVEDDHTLLWMSPQAALVALDRDSHAWAVAAWLRRLHRQA